MKPADVSPGAYAIVKSDPPQLFLADNAQVISRLIALKVVAAAEPAMFGSFRLEQVRKALLEQRWADAVVAWMDATGTDIDVYEEFVPVWTEDDLDADLASFEIRMARLFGESGPSVAPTSFESSTLSADPEGRQRGIASH